MFKTNLEAQYEKLVIHHISCLDICPAHRAALFLDFYQAGKSYYDDLCDLLYHICVGNLATPLWFSNSGKIYSNDKPLHAHDTYLSSCEELPLCTGDLLEPLAVIFSKIHALSRNEQTNVFY